MKTRTFLAALALVSIVMIPSVYAKDSPAWQAAKTEFAKDAANNDIAKRINATANLVKAITPEVELDAAGLLITHIISEIDRNKSGKEEDRVSLRVIETCIEPLKRVINDKAIALIIKNAANTSNNWRARFYVIRAMGGINTPEVIKTLVGLISDKESAVQIAAIESLGALNSAEGVDTVCKLLGEKGFWETKLTMLEYLRQAKSPASLKPIKLFIRDPNIDPRVLTTALEVLEELTRDLPAEGASGSADVGNMTKSVIRGEYYGMKIQSSRIVFIMDVSGSMAWMAKEEKGVIQESTDNEQKKVTTGPEGDNKNPNETKSKMPDELKKKKRDIDLRPVKTRIDSVKKELVNAICNLDSSVYFSILFYSSAFSIWKNELVPATTENKMAAIAIVEKQSPGGRTNIYDVLEAAYRISGTAGMSKSEAKRVATGGGKGSPVESIGGVDTIFLLTDGNPNEGKIFDAAGIVDSVRKWNEFRKIKINTIAVGIVDESNPDPMTRGDPANTSLMSQIAQVTGGTFVDKTK
ncbi:MAG: HEAT repeat domain-containing protein [Candidatus Brocadiia bacterium]